MATIEVSCPQCHGFRVRKQGTTAQGKQRFLCQNDCCSRSFILDYSNQAYRPGVKEQKSVLIHDIVIGLFINCFEFGLTL